MRNLSTWKTMSHENSPNSSRRSSKKFDHRRLSSKSNSVRKSTLKKKRLTRKKNIVIGVVAVIVIGVIVVVVAASLGAFKKKTLGDVFKWNSTTGNPNVTLNDLDLPTRLMVETNFSNDDLSAWNHDEGDSWMKNFGGSAWRDVDITQLGQGGFWTGVDEDRTVEEYTSIDISENTLKLQLNKGKVYSPSFQSWHNRIQYDTWFKGKESLPADKEKYKKAFYTWELKLQPDIDTVMPAEENYSWRMLWEVKSYPDNDLGAGEWFYRINLQISRNKGTANNELAFFLSTDYDVGKFDWQQFNENIKVPVGEYFKMQLYHDLRNDEEGRVVLFINGVATLDHKGRNFCSNCDMSSINIIKLYTGDREMNDGDNWQEYRYFSYFIEE